MSEYTCEQCGKPFAKHSSGPNRFCQAQCWYDYRARLQAPYHSKKQKLTKEMREQIKASYQPWRVTLRQLAERHGVSVSTAWSIING